MKGWFRESDRHAMAAKGIPTKRVRTGMGNQTATKHRVSDAIQDRMHKLDKLLRKASQAKDPETVQTHLKEAEKQYDKLAEKVKDHKQKYGELPWWVSQIWHGRENFQGNGKVYKQMQNLKNASPQKMHIQQRALFESIRLPTEKPLSASGQKQQRRGYG